MPEKSFPMMSAMIDIAIIGLAKRTDPLTTRVNAGEVLTNLESKQLVHDIFNLASLMKTAAQAVDAAMDELDVQAKEIETMKALLGLSDSEKAGK